MRIFVTGALGFLGRHLVDALEERGHIVIALARDSMDLPAAEMREPSVIVHGSFDQVERALAEYECDALIHLAAQTQVSTAAHQPIGTLEANIRGTWEVLEACRRQNVERVIVASSDKAYGAGQVPYTEKQALEPHGIYATSKACADMIASAYFVEYRVPVAIVRCGNLYGPGHLNWSALIPGAIRSVLAGKSPKLRSSGGPKRDYLFVGDAVRGYVRLVEGGEVGPFNFGTCRGTSAYEVAKLVALAAVRPDLEPVVHAADALGAGAEELAEQVLSYDRAARDLDWMPRFSLVAGLDATLPWYRDYLEGVRE